VIAETMIVVLLATQRSGTNMLRDILDTHDHIRSLPEVFSQNYSRRALLPDGAPYFLEYLETEIAKSAKAGLPKSRPRIVRDYLQFLESKLRDRDCTGIVDIKYSSLHHAEGLRCHPSAPPAMLGLIEDLGYRVVHMVRCNRVACALSLLRAHRTGVFRVFEPAHVERVTYSVSPRRLINEADRIEREQRLVRQWLVESSLDSMEIHYEELFADGPGSDFVDEPFRRVVDFAGVGSGQMTHSPGSRRVSPSDIRDEINNIDEIDSALSSTKHYPHWQALVSPGGDPARGTNETAAGD
jgi:hypothetical protein